MGWNICRELAAWHDVTVLCAPGTPGEDHSIHRLEIEAYQRENGPVPGLTFHFVSPPVLSRLCQRESGLMRRTLYYSGYAAWQRAAYRAALELHRAQPFDLAHQLNITGYREPGYLWKLPIPFVWGPVGGAADIPPVFFPLMSVSDRRFYRMRNWGNAIQKRFGRRCRQAAEKASRIWAIGAENHEMARDRWGVDADDMLESGTGAITGVRPKVREPGQPLRLIWSGVHIGRKALPILLHALAQLKNATVPIQGTILGDGPETGRWQHLADELGVSTQLKWTGKLPRKDALVEVERAEVMVFTSLQEGTPHAVLEALSLGLPVICHDACGMGAAVTDECGIKVAMQSPRESITGFASALRRLCQSPTELTRLSAGALRRATDLTWAAKGIEIARAYDQILSSVPAGRS
jgi:glycosyltransferase involved in cell wall biosynthesis